MFFLCFLCAIASAAAAGASWCPRLLLCLWWALHFLTYFVMRGSRLCVGESWLCILPLMHILWSHRRIRIYFPAVWQSLTLGHLGVLMPGDAMSAEGGLPYLNAPNCFGVLPFTSAVMIRCQIGIPRFVQGLGLMAILTCLDRWALREASCLYRLVGVVCLPCPTCFLLLFVIHAGAVLPMQLQAASFPFSCARFPFSWPLMKHLFNIRSDTIRIG